MEDDKPSKEVKQEPLEETPNSKTPNPQSPPNNPDGQNAQAVSNQSVQNDIEAIGNRVKRAEWFMIGLTAAIALFALAAVIVGGLQWHVMNGQLTEMRNGGVDTHNLAVAAGKQARASKALAEQAKAQTEKMRQALATAATQATATRDLATQAKRQANTASDAIKASRRPWIMVDVSIDSGEFSEEGLRLTIKFSFTNKGADPALYVIPDFDIVSEEAEEKSHPNFSPIGFVKRSLEKLCGEFKDRQNRGGPNNGGFTVFPDQPRSISIGEAMPPNKVAAANVWAWMSDPSKNPNHMPVPHVISPIVLGCVDYEFGSPREDHQTWFAYQLPPLTVTNGPIAQGLLVLTPMLIDRDAFYAD